MIGGNGSGYRLRTMFARKTGTGYVVQEALGGTPGYGCQQQWPGQFITDPRNVGVDGKNIPGFHAVPDRDDSYSVHGCVSSSSNRAEFFLNCSSVPQDQPHQMSQLTWNDSAYGFNVDGGGPAVFVTVDNLAPTVVVRGYCVRVNNKQTFDHTVGSELRITLSRFVETTSTFFDTLLEGAPVGDTGPDNNGPFQSSHPVRLEGKVIDANNVELSVFWDGFLLMRHIDTVVPGNPVYTTGAPGFVIGGSIQFGSFKGTIKNQTRIDMHSEFQEISVTPSSGLPMSPVGTFSSGPAYYSLHTGSPGGGGANELAGGTYIRVRYPDQSIPGFEWDALALLQGVYSGNFLRAASFAAGLPAAVIKGIGIWDAPSGGSFLAGTDTDDIYLLAGESLKLTPYAVPAPLALGSVFFPAIVATLPASGGFASIGISLHTANPGLMGAHMISGSNDSYIAYVLGVNVGGSDPSANFNYNGGTGIYTLDDPDDSGGPRVAWHGLPEATITHIGAWSPSPGEASPVFRGYVALGSPVSVVFGENAFFHDTTITLS